MTLDARERPFSNLPATLSSFVGRRRELAELTRLLMTYRLLTVTGSGGCGKTRLALAVAAGCLPGQPTLADGWNPETVPLHVPDGVWLVELAAIGEPALVPQAVAAMFGLREQPGRTLVETLVGALQSKRLLLVLDNCEHLVDACAALAAALLRVCPDVRILATSRESLGIDGEAVWRVPSLSLPSLSLFDEAYTTGQSPVSHVGMGSAPPAAAAGPGSDLLSAVLESEAVQLFLDRARLVQPTFALSETNVANVGQICRRLDGIPLALELAAPWAKLLSVVQIAARLDDRFRLLVGGSRTAPPRQRTLRATVDWSYDLLTEAEQTLFTRLSVFAGSFDLAAVEAVTSDRAGDEEVRGEPIGTRAASRSVTLDTHSLLSLLRRLVETSLVTAETVDGEARFRLLETLRMYGQERLHALAEREMIERRHAEHYLLFALEASPRMVGAEQPVWQARLGQEYGNLRAALWYLEQSGEVEAALRLTVALGRFWEVRGYFAEAREWQERLLAQGDDLLIALRARVLGNLGHVKWRQSDHAGAQTAFQQSLALYRDLGAPDGMAWALMNLGVIAHVRGEYATARPLYEESLHLWRETERLGLPTELRLHWNIALVLGNLGLLMSRQGEYAVARGKLAESRAIYQSLGDRQGEAGVLANLGLLALEHGDFVAARTDSEAALSLLQALGDRRNMAVVLNNLGAIARELGDLTTARSRSEAALNLYREVGDRGGVASALTNLGLVASGAGDLDQAGVLLHEGLAARSELGHAPEQAESLEALMQLAIAGRQPARAARLFGAAEALRAAGDAPLPPVSRARYDRLLAGVQDQLGEQAYLEAWSEGWAMTPAQAIAYALEAVSATAVSEPVALGPTVAPGGSTHSTVLSPAILTHAFRWPHSTRGGGVAIAGWWSQQPRDSRRAPGQPPHG
ncbi:MAG: ATP-binding protein [Dehalococcoidia bacterium]